MAMDDFSGASQEHFVDAHRLNTEATGLLNQRSELLTEVASKEADIGKKRNDALSDFLKTYKQGITEINKQSRDSIDDTFNLLYQKLAGIHQQLAGDAERLANAREELEEVNRQAVPSQSSTGQRSTNTDRALTLALQRFTRAAERFSYIGSTRDETAATVSGGGGADGGSRGGGRRGRGRGADAVSSTVSADTADALSTEWVFLRGVEDISREAQERSYNAAKAHHERTLELEYARSTEEQHILLRSTEFNIARLQELTNAELKAQQVLNNIDLELSDFQSKKEGGGTTSVGIDERALDRKRQIEAEQAIAAGEEIEKRLAAYRNQLNYESILEYGALSDEQAILNETRAREEFATRKEEIMEQIKLEHALKNSDAKLAEALEQQKVKRITELEYRARLRNHGILTKEEEKAIAEQAEKEFKASKENLAKIEKQKEKDEQKAFEAESKRRLEAGEQALSTIVGEGHTLKERFEAFKSLASNSEGEMTAGQTIKAAVGTMVNALSDLAAKLETTVDEVGSYKGDIDTRLQGSNNKTSWGSYWDQLTKDMMSVGAVTPFFKQANFANNIKSLVDQGIAFDLKQRAFLMTIQEKIANTFNVADGTLLRLIRIQQEDSTAGRLGMESALNTFLNEMYENTEYLKGVADSVRTSLQEMEALAGGAAATEIEYQVQKWMGSLYSVGMSQEAVTAISGALGQIAAGQIDALTSGNGAGNLLVMAANDAGIPISDILSSGLNAEETNKLLQATVNYLAEIAESSKDNRAVQQQLANVFGVKASDLRAATNLVAGPQNKNSIGDIYNENLTYGGMIDQLNLMAGTMYKRTSIGEMLSNVWENGQYTLAAGMANNPISYITYKAAKLLDSVAGGIALPFLNVMGFGVDLETTVADLMRVGSMAGGVLGNIGSIISGLGSSFSGQSMLKKMGIENDSGLEITPRGGPGVPVDPSTGKSTSESGYVGNGSGNDIKNATIQESEDTKEQLMVEAKEQDEEAAKVTLINANVLEIYKILEDVTTGKKSFQVKMAGYGLIGTPSTGGVDLSGSSTGSVNGNTSSNGGTSGGFGDSSTSTSSAIAGSSALTSSSGRLDLGGWTMY